MTVEVGTNSMAIGLQLKDDLDTFLKEKIYPILDMLFSENYSKNKIVRFENIELNIDLNSGEKLDTLITKIENEIQKEISKKEVSKTEIEIDHLTQKTVTQNRQEAFLYYLKKGQYPWWFDENTNFTINDLKTIDIVVFKSIMKSTICLNRLIYQFDIKFIIYLYYAIFKINKKLVNSLGKIPNLLQNEALKVEFFKLVFQFKSTSHFINFSNKFYQLIDSKIVTKISSDSESIQLQKREAFELIKLFEFCNEILRIPIQLSSSKKEKNEYSFSMNKSLEDALQNNKKIVVEISEKVGVLFIKKSIQKPPFSQQKDVPKLQENISKNIDGFGLDLELEFDEKIPSNIEEGILLNNAGLVLIHPFIKHFFEKLEFLSEGKIKTEKLDKAVHVLHYLACKQEQPPEHLLVFEKYLCNIPTEYPVKRFITLSKRQKEACEELLKAMLSHWKGLKTQNVDALRSEFLMREGKLTTTNDKDSLYIQRKTQDILLDSIPWNVHLVKIPWKKKLVFVEW